MKSYHISLQQRYSSSLHIHFTFISKFILLQVAPRTYLATDTCRFPTRASGTWRSSIGRLATLELVGDVASFVGIRSRACYNDRRWAHMCVGIAFVKFSVVLSQPICLVLVGHSVVISIVINVCTLQLTSEDTIYVTQLIVVIFIFWGQRCCWTIQK